MTKPWVTMVMVGIVTTALWAQPVDMSSAMATAAGKADGALALVQVVIRNQLGEQSVGGPAVCIEADKGLLMTLALPTSLRTEDIQRCEIIIPGAQAKVLKATLLGIDPSTGLSFVQADESHDWNAVQFASRSNISIGDPIVSAGLMLNVEGYPLSIGSGYAAARLRVPERMVHVTGGNLTGVCSPVFSADGRAIGLVARQLYMEYQTTAPRGVANVPLMGKSASSFFVPVEEFVHALTRIPTGGEVKRLPFTGIGAFAAITPQERDLLERPGVKVQQVIPGYPAAEVGLSEGDIIVAMDGQRIEQLATPRLTRLGFVRDLMRKPLNDTVRFTVVSGRQTRDVELKLLPMPELPSESKRLIDKGLGLAVREKVTLDKYLDESPSADVEGLVVLAVGAESPAERAGLRQGDVVTKVGDRFVKSVEAFSDAVRAGLTDGGSARLTVRRGEADLELQLSAPAQP